MAASPGTEARCKQQHLRPPRRSADPRRDRPPYLLQAPPAAGTAGDRLPLVLELHGRGIDAETFDRMTGFGALAGEGGLRAGDAERGR